MGLDIYAQKTKVGKGVNPSSVSELAHYRDKRASENFRRKLDKIVAAINDKQNVFNPDTPLEVYRAAVQPLYNFLKKSFGDYTWYYEWLYCEDVETLHPNACEEYIKEQKEKQHVPTLDEFYEKIAWVRKAYYPRAEVYFRKVNFVYAYFMDRLEEEACTFDKDDVIDIIDRCVKIIDAAAKCNSEWFDETREHINPKFYWDYYENEHWLNSDDKTQKKVNQKIDDFAATLNTDWVSVAEELLPTQSGFFFGSTEYNAYYLADVLNCRRQFTDFLNTWKEGEVAFIEMSW